MFETDYVATREGFRLTEVGVKVQGNGDETITTLDY